VFRTNSESKPEFFRTSSCAFSAISSIVSHQLSPIALN
jgi:hypothetical protein